MGAPAERTSRAMFNEAGFAGRIRAREGEALRAVVKAYLPQILRAARGAGLDPTRAEDVAQDTFTTFIETAPNFEGRSHVRTWLFGILYKKIGEERRELGRDRELDEIDEVVERRFDEAGGWSAPPRPTDATLRDREIREHIAACLEEAPTKQRMAFILREVDELPTEELCKILGVTRTNLGVILYRIRNRLRECLESRGMEA